MMRSGTWPSILLIYLYCVVGGLSVGKLIPLLPNIAATTGVSLQSAAWLVSIISAASILIAPLGGTLSDRLGDRRIVGLGLLIMICGNLAGWSSSRFDWLLLARFIEGVGFVFVSLGATAMMARTTEGARQASAMTFISTGVPMGVGLGVALAGQIAATNWHAAFLLHCFPLIALFASLTFTPKIEIESVTAKTIDPSWISVINHGPALRLGLGILFSTIVIFGFGTLFPVYASSAFDLPQTTSARFGLLSYPTSIIGSLWANQLLKGNGTKGVVLGCFTALAISGSVMFWSQFGLSSSTLALVLFYVVAGVIGAWGMAQLPHVAPSPAALGMTASVVIQSANAGMLICSPLTYLLFGLADAAGLSILACVCSLAALVCWSRLRQAST